MLSPYDHKPNRHLAAVIPGWLESIGMVARPVTPVAGPRLRTLAAGRRVIRAFLPERARQYAARLVPRDRALSREATRLPCSQVRSLPGRQGFR